MGTESGVAVGQLAIVSEAAAEGVYECQTAAATSSTWSNFIAGGGGGGAVDSVTSGDADLLTISPTIGAVIATPINQEIDVTEFNTFYGVGAGNVGVHSGASSNVGVGRNALAALTGGDGNNAIGDGVFPSLTLGVNNIGIGGFNTGFSLIDGFSNLMIGAETGEDMTSGFRNILIGDASGRNVTVGDTNIFVGFQCGGTCQTGVRNILIGRDADTPAIGTSDYLNISGTIIGDFITNRVRIGDDSSVITGDVSLRLGLTDSAFMTNVLTTTQRDALTEENGMYCYNSTDDKHQFREAGAWVELGGGGATQLTFAAMIALGSPSAGDVVFVTDAQVQATFVFNATDSEWTAPDFIILNNNEGAALVAGDVVEVDASVDFSVSANTVIGNSKVLGVVVVGGAASTDVLVRTHGKALVNKVAGTITRDEFLFGTATAGNADGRAGGSLGDFAIALEDTSASQIVAYIGFPTETAT